MTTGFVNSIGQSVPIAVNTGGTGIVSATAYAVLCGGTTSTGAFQSIASVGSAGQALVSNGAENLPTFQAIGAYSTVNQTASTVTMTANVQYINTSASNATVTYTVPGTAELGAMFRIMGVTGNSGGWVLQANTGQTIWVGSTVCSSAGTWTSGNKTDVIEIVCTVANTVFTAVAGASLNLTWT